MILQHAASRYGYEPRLHAKPSWIQSHRCTSLLDQVYSPTLHPLTLLKTVMGILKYCIGTHQILWSWYSIFMVTWTQPVLESMWISQIWREMGQLLGSLSYSHYQNIFSFVRDLIEETNSGSLLQEKPVLQPFTTYTPRQCSAILASTHWLLFFLSTNFHHNKIMPTLDKL